MIVPDEFAQAFDRLHPLLASVESRAELLLRGVANSVGGKFAGSRIKPVDSLYMKLEREGESASLANMDDLVAATIVIPNKTVLSKAEALLQETFDRATPVPVKTNRPENFIYDDRHLIVRLKPDPIDPVVQESQVNIEVQLKTEMQAASSAVTRSLSYKPTVLSWARSRLAGQLRALVEVADNLLAAIESGQDENLDGSSNTFFTAKNELLRELERSFPTNELPDDRRRFAGIIESIQKDCKPRPSTDDLGHILRADQHAAIRQAQSLSVIQKVFLILLAENLIGTMQEEEFKIWGTRSYMVTGAMEALYPPSRLIPTARRLHVRAEFP